MTVSNVLKTQSCIYKVYLAAVRTLAGVAVHVDRELLSTVELLITDFTRKRPSPGHHARVTIQPGLRQERPDNVI